MSPKISIIGVGHMGASLYAGIQKVVSSDDIMLCDRSMEKLETLSPTHSTTDVNEAVAFGDVIIIAVKPQQLEPCSEKVQEDVTGKLVISIIAGVSIATIQKHVQAPKVVRSMPNLGVAVSQGVTCFFATEAVSEDERAFVHELFSAVGESIEVPEESFMDSVVALSGSGPAYFFYLCELMEEKTKTLGFTDEQARKMAEGTFLGAAKLLESGGKSAAQWRTAVTSKGGTTEAALSSMADHQFDQIFWKAIEAAKKRSEELN